MYRANSSDMLRKVQHRQSSFNNSGSIANSRILSNFKLVYYHTFAYLYGFFGSFSDVVMVNLLKTRKVVSVAIRNYITDA